MSFRYVGTVLGREGPLFRIQSWTHMGYSGTGPGVLLVTTPRSFSDVVLPFGPTTRPQDDVLRSDV